MKNNNLNAVLTSVVLIFNCNDPRITEQVLLSIIEEANQSLGCFKLRDYVLNSHKTIVRFELVMTYSSATDMLNKFAWLTVQVVQEGFFFSLEDSDFAILKKEVVNGYRDDNGNVVKVVVDGAVTNAVTTTKVKRKYWNY
jgi:hypothetical protein